MGDGTAEGTEKARRAIERRVAAIGSVTTLLGMAMTASRLVGEPLVVVIALTVAFLPAFVLFLAEYSRLSKLQKPAEAMSTAQSKGVAASGASRAQAPPMVRPPRKWTPRTALVQGAFAAALIVVGLVLESWWVVVGGAILTIATVAEYFQERA